MMKRIKIAILAGIASFAWTSCQQADARYIDLATGEEVVLEKDDETGEMVDVNTGKTVRLYVNTKTKDTIYGPSEKIVNNEVVHVNNMYVYKGDSEAWTKMKMEEDGDYKVKYGDEDKVKYSNGEYKIKRGDYKKEVEKDGDVTIKNGNVKVKIDGETGERKVKVDD